MRIRLMVAALLVPCVAAACSKTESKAGSAMAPATAAQPAPAPGGAMSAAAAAGSTMAKPAAAAPVTVTMAPKGNSGISGTATLTTMGDSVKVEVSLHGLAQGKTYPTHIHNGSCAQEGAVAVPLTSVQGQAGGTGSSTTVVPASSVPTGPHFVQSHLPDMTPAACGDVPAAGGGM